MDNTTFETRDLRVRIEDNVAHVDQSRLEGERWREIDQNILPVSLQWLMSPVRTSPLKIALKAFETENPGNQTLRNALGT